MTHLIIFLSLPFLYLLIYIYLKIKSRLINSRTVRYIPPTEVLINNKRIEFSIEEDEEKADTEILNATNNWIIYKCKELNNTSSLVDLINTKSINEINYNDLLHCFEWRSKRLQILIRDKFKCRDCGTSNESNHVHHLYYVQDELPWNIHEDGLVTLCHSCHNNRHKNQDIQIFKMSNNRLVLANTKSSVCSRCNGTGHLSQFKHVENGICFKCGGSPIEKIIFQNKLHQVKQDLKYYNVESRRSEYRSFILKISTTYYKENIEQITNVTKLVNEGSYSSPIDDLPF